MRDLLETLLEEAFIVISEKPAGGRRGNINFHKRLI